MFNKRRIGIIVQRYGNEVVGGAESLAKLLAELLVDTYDVTVITTKAISHNSWTNYYKKNHEIVNRVNVLRFPVEKERDMQKFKVFASQYDEIVDKSLDDDYRYLIEQGPYTPEMYNYLKSNIDSYDMFFVITYDFIHSYESARILGNKAIFIPTAHDEPGFGRGSVKEVFNRVGAVIYLTEEEKQLAESLYRTVLNKPSIVLGMYLDFKGNYVKPESSQLKDYLRTRKDYVCYVGRVEESKGCAVLFDYFQRYLKVTERNIDLVIAGKEIYPVPRTKNIKYLGYVSTNDKYVLMSKSHFLINPSIYESFSFIILEAWMTKIPVLVNGNCKVLKGQCERSNGGLWFENFEEFVVMFEWLLENDRSRKIMGEAGRSYVKSNYSRNVIYKKIYDFITNFKINEKKYKRQAKI